MTLQRISNGLKSRFRRWFKSAYEGLIFYFFCRTDSPFPDQASVSPYKVCFISVAGGGAWSIRGVEIASCRSNWHSTLDINSININDFDIFIFVKHVHPEWVARLKNAGKIVVCDIVDGWQQPEDDQRLDSIAKIRQYFSAKWDSWDMDGFIFPDRKMWEDLHDLTPKSGYIYHRFHPMLCPISIRKNVKYVGYTGEQRFLLEWEPQIRKLCEQRGIKFIVNPLCYRSVDIAFAARGGPYNSYLATSYKSNVKLANCYGSGTPALFLRANSYGETDNGAVQFFTNPQDLESGLDNLLNYEHRLRIHQSFLDQRPQFALKTIAIQYEEFCRNLLIN